MYSTAVEQLIDAHNCMEKRISEYNDSYSGILEAQDDVYSNIEWPLSRTQCSSETLSKATVDAHLKKLTVQLKLAEDKIRALAQDWDDCVVVESKVWCELGDSGKQKHDVGLRDSFGPRRNISLREKAQSIAKAKSERIDGIEDVSNLTLSHAHYAVAHSRSNSRRSSVSKDRR